MHLLTVPFCLTAISLQFCDPATIRSQRSKWAATHSLRNLWLKEWKARAGSQLTCILCAIFINVYSFENVLFISPLLSVPHSAWLLLPYITLCTLPVMLELLPLQAWGLAKMRHCLWLTRNIFGPLASMWEEGKKIKLQMVWLRESWMRFMPNAQALWRQLAVFFHAWIRLLL